MADKMLRISGRGEDGTAKPIQTDDNGIIKVTPSTKAIEEITIFDELAIRDTNNHEKSINLSNYKTVTFVAYSRLDEDVDILIRHEGQTIKVWDGSKFIELKATITTSERYFKIILNSALPELNNNFVSLIFRLRCYIPPTEGDFSLKAYGELR